MSETAISVVNVGFQITKLEELREFSKILANSQMVPKDYIGKPDAVLAGILFGQELGLSPLQSLQNIANINGRPAIWGDLAKALVERSGQLEEFEEWYELDGERLTDSQADEALTLNKNVVAKCLVKRKGRPATTSEFSWNMAKKAGLTNKETPWKYYPARMLKMRPRGFNLRDTFADVLKGLPLREEMLGEVIDLSPTGEGAYATAAAETSARENGGPSSTNLAAKLKMPKANEPVKEPQPAALAPLEPTEELPSTETPPKASDYQRGLISLVKPKDGPSGSFAVVEMEIEGKSMEMIYAPSGEAKVTVNDLQAMIGQSLFYLVKADKKAGKLVRQMYDVFPEDVFEAAMLEREAKAANLEQESTK